MANLFYSKFKNFKKIFYVFFLLAGFGAGIFLYKLPYKPVNLSIDMEADRGSYLEVYINQDWANPYKKPLVDKRNIYIFKNIPGLIKSIRIDPTNAAGANVKIYGISFKQADRDLMKIPASDMAGWNFSNTKKKTENGAGLTFSSVTPDPILAADINCVLVREALPFSKFFSDPALFGVFVVISGLLLIAVFGLGNKSRFILAPLLIFFSLQWALQNIADMILAGNGTPPPVSNAVGCASFLGYPKSLEIRMVIISVFAAFITAMISVFIKKKIKQDD